MNTEVKNALTALVQSNIDSHHCFIAAGENVTHNDCLSLFRRLSEERSFQAKQLQEVLAVEQEFPQPTGTATANAHRIWINIRGALSGRNESAILPEVIRGEEHLIQEYGKALPVLAETPYAELVTVQFENISNALVAITELAEALEHLSTK